MLNLFEDDPLAVAVIGAIRNGNVEVLRRLLAENPESAAARITRRCRGNKAEYSYPLIGAATDWPGHYPNVSASIAALVAAGADPNARAAGPHQETALHGAASSDDVTALDALLDAGADIEASGAVIAGGTPLDDAVGFGQWRAALRLVDRGAQTRVNRFPAIARSKARAPCPCTSWSRSWRMPRFPLTRAWGAPRSRGVDSCGSDAPLAAKSWASRSVLSTRATPAWRLVITARW